MKYKYKLIFGISAGVVMSVLWSIVFYNILNVPGIFVGIGFGVAFASCYSDDLFEKIISEIRYPYAMAYSLHKKLAEKHIPNNCLEIFEKIEGQK